MLMELFLVGMDTKDAAGTEIIAMEASCGTWRREPASVPVVGRLDNEYGLPFAGVTRLSAPQCRSRTEMY